MDIKHFTPSRSPEFCIVDFEAVAKHAFHSGQDPNCTYDSVTGKPVNTAEFSLRTFCDMYLIHWLDTYSTCHILVCHDSGTDFRTNILPNYKPKKEKEKGPEGDQEKEKFFKLLKSLFAGLGITQMKVSGVEADDIISHLVQKLSPNYICNILTVDSDMLALSNENTVVWMKNRFVSPAYTSFTECVEEVPKNMWGYLHALCDSEDNFFPEVSDNVFQFVTLYKSIVGDSADGYSGVKGLGDKSWDQLVKEFGIDGMQELQELVSSSNWTTLKDTAEEVNHKVVSKLNDCRHEWRQSWRLAQLHPELCWKPTKNSLTKIDYFKRVPSADRVKAVLTECDAMEELWDVFKDVVPTTWLIDSENFAETDIEEFSEACKSSPVVGWDYETYADALPRNTFNALGSKPTGISFCFGRHLQYAFYLTVNHKDSNNLPVQVIGEFINAIPEDTPTVAHNLQFETIVTLQNFNTAIKGGYDTATMSSYVNENEKEGLKACSKRELNYTQETYQEVLEDAYQRAWASAFKDSGMSKAWADLKTEQTALQEALAQCLASNNVDGESEEDTRTRLLAQESETSKAPLTGLLNTIDAINNELKTLSEDIETLKASVPAVTGMHQVTADDVMSYGIDDSLVCAHLYQLYWLVMQLEGSWDFYAKYKPNVTLRSAISHCEGVNLDLEELSAIHKRDIATVKQNTERLREVLQEHRATPPTEKVISEFLRADEEFRRAKIKLEISEATQSGIRTKLTSAAKTYKSAFELGQEELAAIDELTKLIESKADVPTGIAAKLIYDAQVYKSTAKAQLLGTYVPYTETQEVSVIAPTPKNLSQCCAVLDLPPITSATESKILQWAAGVRQYDFDSDSDLFDELTSLQREFVSGIENAVEFFKVDKRECEQFLSFNSTMCEILGKATKTVQKGSELSTGSPTQMQHMLYVMLGLPVRNRSVVQKGSARHKLGCVGSPSTDALAINTALAEDVQAGTWVAEVLHCLKSVKESETRISLYHTPYPEFIHPATGKLHPSLKDCGTVTRRPTCYNPNLLQVSKHQDGGSMRGPFKPSKPGHVIVSMDFSGQELRMLASVTKDFNLLCAYLGKGLALKYLNGIAKHGDQFVWDVTAKDLVGIEDVKELHSNTGASIASIFGLDSEGELVVASLAETTTASMTYEEFITALESSSHPLHKLCSKIRKRPAKTANFLMAYGGGPSALALKLIVKEEVGKKISKATSDQYSGIEIAQQAAHTFALRHGYTETAYGNRRHMTSDLFSKDKGTVSRLARQGFNATIQGCAAEVLSVVISDAEDANLWERTDSVMIAPVYDELMSSVNAQHAVEYVSGLRDIMNITPPGHAIPMMADISLGPDWRWQKELGPFPSDEVVQFWTDRALELVGCRDEKLLKSFVYAEVSDLTWGAQVND